MKQWLIEFQAEYYCQGMEWATFQRLVSANTFLEACNLIKKTYTADYECASAKQFHDLTIN